jgi:lysophospholipase L1-like esterase
MSQVKWILAAAAGAALWWHLTPRVKRGEKILLIGDSLGLGLGSRLRPLFERSGNPFVFTATEGTRVDQWASTYTAQGQAFGSALAASPDVVLISLGTNDAYMTDPGTIAKVTERARSLLDRAAAAGARVYWIGPPKLPRADNGAIAQIKRLIPWHRYFHSESLVIPRQSDGLHPDVAGYEAWAASLWRWLT